MMHITLTEPVSPRYIHINSITNQVHLMVPVVSGQEISTDNTCKSTLALREFFDGGALLELKAYKDKLTFDIGLLEANDLERARKEARLTQIEAYIKAIPVMQYHYANAIATLMKKQSNLYSIQLRPSEPDYASQVVNPAFSIERGNDKSGTPLSPLYRAFHALFPATMIANQSPQSKLITAVLEALPDSPAFEDIQRVLQTQCKALFDIMTDFTRCTDGRVATKEVIDELAFLGGSDTKPENYINALLGFCAPSLWRSVATPPFYSISEDDSVEERTESLSILSQFFLANLNVYCQSKGISSENFGLILDANPKLSEDLAFAIYQALTAGAEVEQALCNFYNTHRAEFKLSRLLNPEDVNAVKQKFTRTWRTISKGENSHMDDFMILDTETPEQHAKFVSHQGAICVNFAEIISFEAPNQAFFKQVREDFTNHPMELPHLNQLHVSAIEIEPEVLLTRINDDQFEQLPDTVKEACHAHPGFQLHHFLHHVAKGKEQQAKALLNDTRTNTQHLLRSRGVFTDYSGRTFNCTAYEYAYWAKDTPMCRMLESYMDTETKSKISGCITEIERINEKTRKKIGLEYKQHGKICCSAHFDLNPLIQALKHYEKTYEELAATREYDDLIQEAWRKVGKEQRDVPAHVAQEYCRKDRSFDANPQFKEATLPRDLVFHNTLTGKDEYWFPLAINTGLGFDMAIMRSKLSSKASATTKAKDWMAAMDWQALTSLDKVRTTDLKYSCENLKPEVQVEHRMTR